MLLLKKKCRNCYCNSIEKCVLVEVLLLDYLKLDQELACLEQQESKANAAELAALEALLAARAKKDQLCKQRKVLARRKRELIDKLEKFIKEIKALQAAENINFKVSVLKSSLMPSTLALDQSTFSLTYLEGNSIFNNFLAKLHSTI